MRPTRFDCPRADRLWQSSMCLETYVLGQHSPPCFRQPGTGKEHAEGCERRRLRRAGPADNLFTCACANSRTWPSVGA